jgi:phosphohistidine swiveling domain-containing protein
MHMPHAFTTLAGEWACDISDAFLSPYLRYPEHGPFPQEWFSAVWNGYVYYAYRRNVPDEQRKTLFDRMIALNRARIAPTHSYWRDELIPELQRIYNRTASIPVETMALAELADAWEGAWAGSKRAWDIHFDIICGPYQVMDDLVDAYAAAVPDAPAGEALRLTQGQVHELYEVEVAMERLAAMVTDSPALADAVAAGGRSLDELRGLDGGEPFATAFEAFLAEHGHLGQSVDDLILPSWADEPSMVLAELAKRLEGQPEPAEARRARLAAEAGDLADAVRARLADRPEELATFDELVRQARKIGFLTEVHNYWIDRKDQAVMHTFSMRVGRRMLAEGLLEQPEDIFHLHRHETAAALRAGADQRELVTRRRAEHERNQRRTPPRIIGKAPPPPIAEDRFNGANLESTEAGVLRGTGSSAGVATGPARVVLTSLEFDRIRPGDIIVCPSSNPSWVPIFTIAGGLVTNTGGVLSHAAVVAREFGLPAVTGVAGATTAIRDGQQLEIDGTAGTVRLL